MRILSQDGLRFDIQYENCHLVVNEKCCEVEAETSNPNFTPVMASYSSIEKCRKAMNTLRDAYMGCAMYRTMSEQQKALFLASMSEKEQKYLYGVFCFPADSEVEV